MKKSIVTIYFYLFCFTSVLADRSDYGRVFSDNSESFFYDNPIGRIIALVIGIILSIIMITIAYNDDKESNSGKGCLISFFIILMIIAILCVMA